MKKTRLLIGISIVALCILGGCSKEDTVSEIVKINKTSLVLAVDQSERLTLSGAQEPEWSSSDESIARVFYGAVTGVSEGEAIITAAVDGKSYRCTVSVIKSDEKEDVIEKSNTSQSQPSENKSSNEPSVTMPSDKGEAETSSQKDESQLTKETAEALTKKWTHDAIDKDYDAMIAEFTEECDKNIADVQVEIDDLIQKMATLSSEESGLSEALYQPRLEELQNEKNRLEKIRSNGIDTYNRRRAEEKENWRDRGLIVN